MLPQAAQASQAVEVKQKTGDLCLLGQVAHQP